MADQARPPRRRYWLDDPANVELLVRIFYLLCAIVVVVDVFVPKHGPFRIEHLFGFYGWFGFVSCVALVLIAKLWRKVVIRPEDYYER